MRDVREPGEDAGAVRWGPVSVPVGPFVYGTVTLMSVLVVYKGWKDIRGYFGVAVVVIGPALALALAHLFAEVLEDHVHLRRPLRRAEWRSAVASAAVFLMIVVPPLALLLVGRVFSIELRTTVYLMIWMGVASLAFWGWLAGRRAGLAGLRLVASSGAGLAIGLVVVALQLVLKPG